MIVSWVVVVVVVDENDVVINLIDIDLNIDDREKEETKQWDICVSDQWIRGWRQDIYISIVSLCLLFLLQHRSASASTPKEEEEVSKASAWPMMRREEEEEASVAEQYDIEEGNGGR